MFRTAVCLVLSDSLPPSVIAARIAIEKLMIQNPGTFGSNLLRSVDFCPDKISVDESGRMLFPFHATPGVGNIFDTVHGGAWSSFADVFTTVHLWGIRPEMNHVSITLSLSFFSSAKIGQDIVCRTTAQKVGKRVAFTEFSFEDSASGQVLVSGSHVKSFVSVAQREGVKM